MAINPDELRRHLDDYARWSGKRVDRFVCPITERRCEESELMNGHILCDGIISASSKTVIQYGDIDHFYGTRVEPSVVRFINIPKKTPADLLSHVSNVKLNFSDGSTLTGFFAGPEAGKKFPCIDLRRDGMLLANIYVRTEVDDPRLQVQGVQVEWTMGFQNSHWVAAMVKSAYLALFRILGYRFVLNAYGEFIRQTLNSYYQDRASSEAAFTYFWPFRNALKMLIRPDTLRPESDGPDTLEDSTVLIHKTSSGMMFAISLRFKMNDLIALVTLPMCHDTKLGRLRCRDACLQPVDGRRSVCRTAHSLVKIREGQVDRRDDR